jgi:hypothetical protein
MNLNQRDLARRFITFIDAVYESRVRLIPPSYHPFSRTIPALLTVFYLVTGKTRPNNRSPPNKPLPLPIRRPRLPQRRRRPL